MNNKTEADKQLDAARQKTKEALIALNEILISDCDGSADYNETFYTDMQYAHELLMKTKKLLRVSK